MELSCGARPFLSVISNLGLVLLVVARKRVADVCTAYGKFAGTIGSSDDLETLVEMGYRFINIGIDVLGLDKYCRDLISKFGKHRVRGSSESSVS